MATRGPVSHSDRAVAGRAVLLWGLLGALRGAVRRRELAGDVVAVVPDLLRLLHAPAVVADAFGHGWRAGGLVLLLVVHEGLLVGPGDCADDLLLAAVRGAGGV